MERSDTLVVLPSPNTQEDEASQSQTQALEFDEEGNLRTGLSRKKNNSLRTWGRLMSLNSQRPHVELVKTTIVLGRSVKCDVVFPKEGHISGVHCVIEKRIPGQPPSSLSRKSSLQGSFAFPTSSPSSQGGTSGVWLVDKSSNGTYVNGELVGKGKAVQLHHRDEISLVYESSSWALANPEYKKDFAAYIYQELKGYTKDEDNENELPLTPTLSPNRSPPRVGGMRRTLTSQLSMSFDVPRAQPPSLSPPSKVPSQKRQVKQGDQSSSSEEQSRLPKKRKLAQSPTSTSSTTSSSSSSNSTSELESISSSPSLLQRRFYEVDLQALEKCDRVKLKRCDPPGGEGWGYTIATIQPPHVADTSVAAEIFKMAELSFRRFINRDRIFTVKSVDVIVNPELEKRFKTLEAEFNQRAKDSGKNKRLLEEWEGKPAESRVIGSISDSIYWCSEDESMSDAANPILAWHGTPQDKLPAICSKGFLNLSEKDTGWYGKGIYFTQMPNYGQFYINNCMSELGESFSLLLSWVLLGRPYPLVSKLEGSGCAPGFDSHVILVDGFEPCDLNTEPSGDEIVVFNEAQALPRYIVNYEVTKKVKFTPLKLLDSDEDEDSEEDQDEDEEDTDEKDVPKETEQVTDTVLFRDPTSRLYVFNADKKAWDRRGAGEFKIIQLEGRAAIQVRPTASSGDLLLNVPVFGGMSCELASHTSIRAVCVEEGSPVTLLFVFSSGDQAQLCLNVLNQYTTPGTS